MSTRPIKLHEIPIYPSGEQAKSYARLYKNEGEPPLGWRKGYLYFTYSDTIQVLTTWGFNNVFFVVAYPTKGVTIMDTAGVEALALFEGWILEYQPTEDTFDILCKASRDGYDYWKQRRVYYKDIV
jgi:hypothetical protein